MTDKIEFSKIKNIKELEGTLKHMSKNSYYPFELDGEKMIVAH